MTSTTLLRANSDRLSSQTIEATSASLWWSNSLAVLLLPIPLRTSAPPFWNWNNQDLYDLPRSMPNLTENLQLLLIQLDSDNSGGGRRSPTWAMARWSLIGGSWWVEWRGTPFHWSKWRDHFLVLIASIVIAENTRQKTFMEKTHNFKILVVLNFKNLKVLNSCPIWMCWHTNLNFNFFVIR
jgi:hypothetical protein